MTASDIRTLIRNVQQFVLQIVGAYLAPPASPQRVPVRVRVEDRNWLR
jgi:hypothetical protein